MLCTGMERKITDIIDAIKLILHDKDFEVNLINNLLIKEFSEGATGVALEQAVVEEIEYMIKNGLFDTFAEDLAISLDEIERRLHIDKEVLAKSITSRLYFQELIKEEFEAYFHDQREITVQYNQEMMDTIQFLQLTRTIKNHLQMLKILELQIHKSLSSKIIKELFTDFQGLSKNI